MRSFLIKVALFVAFLWAFTAALLHVPGFADQVHSSGPVYERILGVGFGAYLSPAILFLLYFWQLILRQSGTPFDTNITWVRVIMLAFEVAFSYVFWTVLWTRSAKILGLWNPFKFKTDKPWVFKIIVKIGDWWEILTRFGKVTTGGWAGLLEVLSNRYQIGDIFLGRPRFKIGGGMLRAIGIPTEKHMVTLAGTGSGKSTAALIPNLCIHPGSLLCIDPKGELAMITASRRGAGGEGVRRPGAGCLRSRPVPHHRPYKRQLQRLRRNGPDRRTGY